MRVFDVPISAKIIRAFFVGLVIALFGGLGLYMMAEGLNLQSGQQVVNPIAIVLIVIGGTIGGAIAVELSNDIGFKKLFQPFQFMQMYNELLKNTMKMMQEIQEEIKELRKQVKS